LNTRVAEGGKSNETIKRKLEDVITAVKQKNRIRKINRGGDISVLSPHSPIQWRIKYYE